MTLGLAPTQSAIMSGLRSFLIDVLPDGIEVFQAQANRVPPPAATDYVAMTPIRMPRLATNIRDYADAFLVGSIDDLVLTVTEVSYGALAVGSPIFGADVLAGTKIAALGTGTGGVGTYTLNKTQTVASEDLAAGVVDVMQKTEVVVQLDVYGPASADNAQIVSTMFRDMNAAEFFKSNGDAAAPLYADDPRQLPFVDENQQVENRWMVEVHMQANPVVTVPQQFAAAAVVGLIDVDAVYPAV